jgi:hypothetical protein
MVPALDANAKPRPVPKTAGHFSFREKPGQVMMKGAKEERISDVVAIAYSVLALLLMLAWTYVPA